MNARPLARLPTGSSRLCPAAAVDPHGEGEVAAQEFEAELADLVR